MSKPRFDVESYLQHARRVPAAPADVRARLDKRVKASLATSPAARSSGMRPLALRTRWIAPWIVGAAGLALLYAVFAIARHNSLPDQTNLCEKQAKPIATLRVLSSDVEVQSTTQPPSTTEVPSLRPAPRARHHGAATPMPMNSLGGERALLARAREALARGEGGLANRVLAQHASRYPRGALAEEREALRIHAAAMGGDLDAAATLLRAFEQRFPVSVFAPTLRDALNRHRETSAE